MPITVDLSKKITLSGDLPDGDKDVAQKNSI